jgi:hypothetical protein
MVEGANSRGTLAGVAMVEGADELAWTREPKGSDPD